MHTLDPAGSSASVTIADYRLYAEASSWIVPPMHCHKSAELYRLLYTAYLTQI
jgi:hypothetical protein